MSDVRIASLDAQINELTTKIAELKRRRDEVDLSRPFTTSSETVNADNEVVVHNLRIEPRTFNTRRAHLNVTRAKNGTITCAINIDLNEEKLDLLLAKMQRWKQVFKDYIDTDERVGN